MKKYINKVKEKPEQLLFDVFNIVLVLFVIGVLVAVIQWIIGVFGGRILVDPLATSIGSWSIYWYGIFFAVAFAIGFFIIIKEGLKTDRNIDQIINILFWTIVFGFIGARISFAVLNWDYYQTDPAQILNIWQGGLSLYGAIAGGLIFISLYCKFKKIKAWPLLDVFTYALMMGQIIGRWGNLFNQEYFGKASDSIKVYISPVNRPWESRNQSFFHPLFFYESIYCLALFIILLFLKKTGKIKDGFVFLYYILFYSAFRFGIEFLSFDDKVFASFNIIQLFSILIFVISIIAIICKKFIKQKNAKNK